MNPKILSEMTGNTHGIKFKMIPPRKPKKRKVKIPRAGAELTDAIVDTGICHAPRSFPLGRCEKTTRPCIEDKCLPADSIGTRKTISFVLRDSTLGCPTTVSPWGNG